MKSASKKKTITIILVSIVILFILWNLVWFGFNYIKYNNFVGALPETSTGNHILVKDGYTYGVKTPDYLSFTGNLSISNSSKGELLIIWPLPFGGYQYGFRLQENGNVYELNLDENMNLVGEQNESDLKAVTENKQTIQSLYNKAKAIWDLK
ncbi:hypothetical protein SK066_21615 [Paenibacillus hunanensis]|uniref:hypothetical protein n=1 Tax=Paenibacillus hunanensis TaxID=539262 RepID=UPI002A6AC332|nr:hypothetical protein [Paenibacillus hunanensis]WPP41126.1 hypothetical protein SK066_21615 [Paenibacillus hunanensis]